MNFTKEQVEVGLAAGLALTNPESDLLEVFRKHAAGGNLLESKQYTLQAEYDSGA